MYACARISVHSKNRWGIPHMYGARDSLLVRARSERAFKWTYIPRNRCPRFMHALQQMHRETSGHHASFVSASNSSLHCLLALRALKPIVTMTSKLQNLCVISSVSNLPNSTRHVVGFFVSEAVDDKAHAHYRRSAPQASHDTTPDFINQTHHRRRG